MLTAPFFNGIKIIKEIEKTNHQAYFVGGCVRDMLLNRRIKDIDIATSAKPELIQKIFKDVIPVGIEHGTVIVRYNKESYEITTFRVEGQYSDQRHPDSVQFIDQIDEDLKRRDFTINALAMDKNGKIIDLFGGKKDLEDRVIRTVGNGKERFTEDPLRMIRALRFSSQLGFKINTETLACLKELKSQIESLAVERITNECEKLFAGEFINNGIAYLKETKIHHHLPVLKDHPNLMEKLPPFTVPFQSFGEVIALFHYLKPDISILAFVKEWKCSNKIKAEAMELVQAIEYYNTYGLDEWLVYELSNVYFEGFARLVNTICRTKKVDLETINQIYEELPLQSRNQLALNGHDLMELFKEAQQGPWIRETLRELEKKVIFKEIENNKLDLKEWIKCNPPETN